MRSPRHLLQAIWLKRCRRTSAAQRLVSLDLCKRGLQAEGVLAVSQALAEYSPNIQRLSLCDNGVKQMDAAQWKLPEALQVLNVSLNPDMFLDDAAPLALPQGLRALNLQSVRVPSTWRNATFWPPKLHVLNVIDCANFVDVNLPPSTHHVFARRLPHQLPLQTTVARWTQHAPQLTQVTALGENDQMHTWTGATHEGDTELALLCSLSCGSPHAAARGVMLPLLVQRVAHGVGVLGVWLFGIQALALPPDAPASTLTWTQLVASRVCLMHISWQLSICNLTFRGATQGVTVTRRRALGDVNGRLTPRRDAAAEVLYFTGNTLAMAMTAHLSHTLIITALAVTAAPILLPGAAAGYATAIYGPRFGVLNEDILSQVFCAMGAGIAASGATGAAIWNYCPVLLQPLNSMREGGVGLALQRTALLWQVSMRGVAGWLTGMPMA